jgi:predicted nucleic acid-binding protein
VAPLRRLAQRPRVYLDACAVQRPFDRLISAEERAEAAAVLLLLSWSLSSHVDLCWSTILDYETIARAPVERRAWGIFARDIADSSFRPEAPHHTRARELARRLRLGAFDALHVACAEALRATVVTVDRTFLARTAASPRLRVRVMDPVQAVAQLRPAIGDG